MATTNKEKRSEKCEYLFIDFCANNDITQRLDLAWKEKGICELDQMEGTSLDKDLKNLSAANHVILKKNNPNGETMNLFGYGLIRSIKRDDHGKSYLSVWWSKQEQVIEIPLMNCQSNINPISNEEICASLTEKELDYFDPWSRHDHPESLVWSSDPGECILLRGSAGPGDFGFFILIVQSILSGYGNKTVLVFSGEWKKLSKDKKGYLESSASLHDNAITIVPGKNWSIEDIRTKCKLITPSMGSLDFLVIDDYSHQNKKSIFSDDDLKDLKLIAIEFNVLICFISCHQKHNQAYFDAAHLILMGISYCMNRDLSLEEVGM